MEETLHHILVVQEDLVVELQDHFQEQAVQLQEEQEILLQQTHLKDNLAEDKIFLVALLLQQEEVEQELLQDL
jgi:hypothetical protein